MPLVSQPLIAVTPFGSFHLGPPLLSTLGPTLGPPQSLLSSTLAPGPHKSLSAIPSFQTPLPYGMGIPPLLGLIANTLHPPWPRPWAVRWSTEDRMLHAPRPPFPLSPYMTPLLKYHIPLPTPR